MYLSNFMLISFTNLSLQHFPDIFLLYYLKKEREYENEADIDCRGRQLFK